MDIDEKIKDIMQQKQACTQKRRYTFEEFAAVLKEHTQNISGLLFILDHELAKGIDERRAARLHGVIQDFICNELNALTEKIKDCFY